MDPYFRIVKTPDRVRPYRVDQLRRLLFGLIRWWDRNPAFLSPHNTFETLQRAEATIRHTYLFAIIELPDDFKGTY